MAYVTEKRGVFYAVIYEGRNPVMGRERRRWYRCDDRAAAEQLAIDLSERRARQRHTGSLLTVAEYLLGQWLPAKEASVAPSTYARYVTSVDTICSRISATRHYVGSAPNTSRRSISVFSS